jgi:OTU domain-containing protein 3
VVRGYGQVLQGVDGDADAAVEILIAECSDVGPACSCERSSHSSEASGETCCNSSCTTAQGDDNILMTSEGSCLVSKTQQRPAFDAAGQNATLPLKGSAMHKACLCGSKRKYKSCCGTQCPKLTITSVQRLLYLTHLSFLTQFELRSHVMFLLE